VLHAPGIHFDPLSLRLCFRLVSAREKLQSDFMRPFPRSSNFGDFISLKRFCAGALVFFLPFAICSASTASGDYLIDVWSADNGLRSSSVTAIAQTLDGYLWIGTYNGLARFDGVRFVMFDPANTPALQRARVRRLNVDASGMLWINTYDGSLTSFRDGKFQLEWKGDGSSDATTSMISAHTNSITFLLHTGELLRRRSAQEQWQKLRPPGLSSGTLCVEDREGTIWGRGRDQRLWRFSGNHFEMMPTNSGLEGATIHCLTTDTRGTVWVGTEREIAMWSGSCFQSITPTNGESPLNVTFLHIAPDGDVWVIANERVRKARERQWVFESDPCRGLFSGYQDRLGLQEDRNGGIWLYHYGKGLFHIRADGHTRQLALEENFPGERVDCFFEDREGNLWSGVDRGGLVRLRQKRFVSLMPDDATVFESSEEGGRNASAATAKAAVSVAEDSKGGIWIGTYGGGLHRLLDGNWQSFSVPGGTRRGFVFSVCPDAESRLWVSAGDEDLFVKTEEQFRALTPAVHGVKALLAGRDGRVWIGNKSGLWSSFHGQIRQYRTEVRRTDIRALAEGTDGIIWAGTGDGYLYRIATNRVESFQTSDGLPAQPIWSLCADDNEAVWVGTFRGGLLRFRDGHFDRITTKDGLPDDVICQILDDGNGRLWLGSQQGIFWISKSDIDELARGNVKSINCTAYGRYDGLPSLECSGSYQPAACRTHDGHLLFCTLKGVVSVNPQELAPNRLPPPVVIEEVLVDGQAQTNSTFGAPHSAFLTVPPGKRQIEFRYAGLSFVSPDRVRFRYQLVGLDKNLNEAGTRRSAQYSFLPPGDYTFRVTACNNDGVWSEQTAAFSLKVLPHFYEAWWFWPGIALSALVAVAVAVRQVVVRRLHRQLEELERQRAVERDRARIAKDIHDDLGAGLTQITLLSELARREPSPEGHLDRISDSARTLTRRIDEIVWAVDPQHDTLNGLMDYISAFTEDFLRTADIRCRMDMPAALPALHLPAELRYNLFLALKEALNNVVKHSRATEVRLGLRLENNAFTLVIQDNGQGITPAVDNGERLVGGHGLANLEKRLAAIGGRCVVQSTASQGTRIELAVQVANGDTNHWPGSNGSPSPIVATPHNGSPGAQSHHDAHRP
jgi:signal transduction histidine kinase/ligand-binding sensor domain-containing protein